ncbi:MAG: SxtJ family membrane protein [Proteobacteria bacterium]|nr:SxtJ family membrane protein [Pseudomonadota bacterium]
MNSLKSQAQIKKQLRTFGFIWSFIFAVFALLPLLKGGQVRVVPFYISAAFFVISACYPQLYKITYFYQGWIKFGDFVGKINSKIIIFILFYVVFLPISLILKIMGKDFLSKKMDSKKESYFIAREDHTINMKNQF